MGNTVFYNQINEDASQIKWKDIFSEYKKKHDKQDLEYALAAGTALNTASEDYMLQKWRKPWLFYPMLKWGIGFIVLLYIVYFALINSGVAVVPAIEQMTIIIPPLIGPLVLMILFWEMNIPRNISIYELLGIWLVGGLLSLVVANILFTVIPQTGLASIDAPIAEEPAKMIVSMIVMLIVSKNKKIYGISGFVIGAAVGAGFGAFESVQYAFSSAQSVSFMQDEMGQVIAVVGTQMNRGVLFNQIIRLLFSVGGHALYCAPYSAEMGRHSDNGKISLNSVFNIDVIAAFLISCLLHGLWDMSLPAILGGAIVMYAWYVILIVLIWIQGLRILRKCLNQVVQIGAAASNGQALLHGAGNGATSFIEVNRVQRKPETIPQPKAATIKLTCSRGELQGVQWQSNGNTPMMIGRNSNCDIRFSAGAKGVSGQHCSIQLTKFGWTVKDLGSSYGTFVSGTQKILPGTEVKLKQGDVISLGGEENTLTVDLS